MSNECPLGKCDPSDNEDDDNGSTYYDPVIDGNVVPEEHETGTSNHFYVMTLVPMLCITVLSIVLVVVLLIKRGKKKYLYPTGRSFANPNYYSSNDPNAPQVNMVDKRPFIWKRLKYDKNQVSAVQELKNTLYLCAF